MTCVNCGAPARLDRDRGLFICGYCASESVPPATEDGVHILGPTKFKCATCDTLLAEGTLEARELLYCEACRGMLIAMGDFAGLIEVLRSYRDRPANVLPPRHVHDGSPRSCPRCSQAMHHHFYGGPGNVAIDTCEQCSVNWLDKAELQRIVSAPDYAHGGSRYEEVLVFSDVQFPVETAD